MVWHTFFQDMQELYALRASKEEDNIVNLEKQEARAVLREAREVERHRWESARYKWDRQRREEEEELHFAKMLELGVDEGDIPRRRPPPPE